MKFCPYCGEPLDVLITREERVSTTYYARPIDDTTFEIDYGATTQAETLESAEIVDVQCSSCFVSLPFTDTSTEEVVLERA